MADAVFPPSLTRAIRFDGLRLLEADALVRSQVDAGPAQLRPRFTGGDHLRWEGGYDLTRTQLAVFQTFFRDTLKLGALSFAWKNPQTGTTCDFRFLGPPAAVPLSTRGDGSEYWRLAFQLEQLPGTDQAVPPPPGAAMLPGGGGAYDAHESEGRGYILGYVESAPPGPAEEEPIRDGPWFEADPSPPDFWWGAIGTPGTGADGFGGDEAAWSDEPPVSAGSAGDQASGHGPPSGGGMAGGGVFGS